MDTILTVSNSKKGSDLSEPLQGIRPDLPGVLTTIPIGVDFPGAAYGAI
jgi:hypothetical protein